MAAASPNKNEKTRGEAIIRRRGGSLEIQIAKVGVLQSDTVFWCTLEGNTKRETQYA